MGVIVPEPVDLKAAFNMTPADAVSYFRSKGYKITDQWQEMHGAAHARAFTVAKGMRMDILKDVHQAMDDVLSKGLTERTFIQELTPKLQAKGWWGEQIWVNEQGVARKVQLGSTRRLKTIYRTNTQTAYMAGRYRRQLATTDTHPYWQYVAVMDQSTRPSHAQLDGKVFRSDDPIWQYLYPPNGWGCRCRIRALTTAQVKRMGLEVDDSKDMLDVYQVDIGEDVNTGEIFTADQAAVKLPSGGSMRPDKGWSYNPGSAAYGADHAIAQKLGQIESIELRSQLIQSLNNSPLRHQEFARWAENVLDQRRPGHGVQSLGFMTETLAAAVATRLGKEPSRLLAISEKNLIHADSKRHQDDGVALSRTEYLQLPVMLNNPQAVLWDKKHSNLLYVFPALNDGESIKVVVNAPTKIKKARAQLDVLVNTYRVNTSHLKQVSDYEVLEGRLD